MVDKKNYKKQKTDESIGEKKELAKIIKERKEQNKLYNWEIGQRLKSMRVQSGYTQEQFAETLLISDGQYRKIEGGGSSIQPYYMKLLCETYSLDPATLISGKPTAEFDLDLFLNSCDAISLGHFIDRYSAYLKRTLTGYVEDLEERAKTELRTEKTGVCPEESCDVVDGSGSSIGRNNQGY